MAYREVHMTEIKEILLRVKREESVRSISRALGIYRDTINKYISLCLAMGADPRKDAITDKLIEAINKRLAPGTKPSNIQDTTSSFHIKTGLKPILKRVS